MSPGPWAISYLLRRLVAKNIHTLEYDPKAQYRFHQSFMFFWLIAMAGVFFMPAFVHDLAKMLIMQVSLYSNFTSDFGAMSSALAAEQYHCEDCPVRGQPDEFKY